MKPPYRTRFAPSPTGDLHPGHARTLLLTWLRARSSEGTIVLRMEDIDGPRVVPGSADGICRDLEWLGLDWDEGPIFQSDRGEVYETALDRLTKAGLTYPCTCSRKEIALVASAPHRDEGIQYPGTCRAGARNNGRPPATRFLLDRPVPSFDDLIMGTCPSRSDGSDFVLQRGDGVWAYQFVVVVDDADQGITEVVRGADLLSSTPRQLALYEALGSSPPRFAHVPLVVDREGKRLSKRHHSPTIESLRAEGRSAESLIGELAWSLGLIPENSPVQPEALVSGFDWNQIPRASFVWNPRG